VGPYSLESIAKVQNISIQNMPKKKLMKQKPPKVKTLIQNNIPKPIKVNFSCKNCGTQN
jgi:hypothetical protein